MHMLIRALVLWVGLVLGTLVYASFTELSRERIIERSWFQFWALMTFVAIESRVRKSSSEPGKKL